MTSRPTILVFDSGLGGLTVHREIAAIRPDARLVYAADDLAFPYGGLSQAALEARVVTVMTALIGTYEPNLVVIACNTASTVVLADLRKRFSVPFIGTVPAIKPACAASRSRRVSVLGTEATVAREYTKTLIRDFSEGCAVTLVGSGRLAGYAEAELQGEPAPDDAIAAEIAPCFIDQDGTRTDIVVLACTHYPLLLARFQALSPWSVTFIDPAPAIARRVVDLTGAAKPGLSPGSAELHFTSGRPPSAHLVAALAGFGLRFASESQAI